MKVVNEDFFGIFVAGQVKKSVSKISMDEIK